MPKLSIAKAISLALFILHTFLSSQALAIGVIPISIPTPSSPISVSVPSSSSTGNYSLSWSAVPLHGHYNWRQETNGVWDSNWTHSGNGTTSVSLTGRADGNYRYQVKACHLLASPKCGAATTSNLINVSSVTVPSSPPSVTVPSTSSTGTYTVLWAASNNTPTRYEYREYYNGNWTSFSSNGTSLSKAYSTRANGTYAYQVRACNSAGCSGVSQSGNLIVATSSVDNSWQNTGGAIPDAQWGGDTPALTGNTNVGAVQGSGGVSGGAASYNIPIVIAPGRKGVQPSVSLNYSSRSGGGIAGGFGLSAGSSISRCGQTMVHDAKVIGVTYSSITDRLCLDGQRLIKTGGVSYGASGSVYRTAIDSFARITQFGDINSSNSWFKVEHKNGHISYYGESTDARHTQQGRSEVSSWAIKRTTDRSNNLNNVIYSYSNFGFGEHLLNEIAYTGQNTAKGDRYVKFAYQDKVKKYQGYEFGKLWKRTKRLKNIKTYYQTQQIRDYQLSYQVSSFSGRELLSQVVECGAGNICLPATTFNWSQPSNTFARSKNSLTPDMPLDNVNVQKDALFADYNGDGQLDARFRKKLFLGDNLFQTYNVSDADITQENYSTWNLVNWGFDISQGRNRDFDYNLDGRTDIYYEKALANNQSQIGFYTWNDTTESFNNSPLMTDLIYTCNPRAQHLNSPTTLGFPTQEERIGECSVLTADMNGDGLQDFIINDRRTYRAPTTVRVYLRCQGTPCNKDFYEVTQDPYSQTLDDIKLFSPIDINGDGRQDLVAVESNTNVQFIYVLQSNWNGNSFNFTEKRYDIAGVGTWKGTGFYKWGDFNGDGLQDLLFNDKDEQLSIALNNGNGFNSAQQTGKYGSVQFEEHPGINSYQGNSNAQYQIIFDYNKDGLSDVLVPNNYAYLLGGYYPCLLSSGAACPGQALNGNGDPIVSPSLYHRWQHIYKWQVLQAKLNSDGTIGFDPINNLGIVGTLGSIQAIDFDSDGLEDIVTQYGYSNQSQPFPDTAASNNFSTGVYVYKNTGGEAPDLLKSVKNGLGVENKYEYKTLFQMHQNGQYEVSDRSDQFPYFNFSSRAIYVASSEKSDGVGGLNKNSYRYGNAKYHAQGLGFQGFKYITVDDLTGGIRSTSSFYQYYPLSGKLHETKTCLINGGGDECANHAISKSSFSWDIWEKSALQTASGAIADPSQVLENYLSLGAYYSVTPNSQKETQFKTNSTTVAPDRLSVSGDVLFTKENITSFDSCGNAVQSTGTYYDGSDAEQYNKTESITQANYDCNLASWWLNKINHQTITSKAVASPQVGLEGFASIAANTDFQKRVRTDYSNWDNLKRLPGTVRTYADQGAGNAANKTVQVDTSYNDYGLPTSVTTTGQNIAGSNLAARTVSTSYSTDGYFVKTITNSKNHVTVTEVDPTHGQAIKVTDPNGQETLMTYDVFGRVRSTKAAGEPTQYIAYWWCSGVNGGAVGCIDAAGQRAKYRTLTRAKGKPDTLVYYDTFNRAVRSQTRNFTNSSYYYDDTKYNNKGQVLWTSTINGGVSGWQTTYYDSYDALGRLTQKRTPQADNNLMTTSYEYDGFVTGVNVFGATNLDMERKYNGLGQLVYTKDALNGYTNYAYDGAGNPIVLQDANGNPITARYNALGHKEWVNDPNMGLKEFKYNTLGEVEWERDANQDVLTYSYDTLGRMFERKTNNVRSGYWHWDNGNVLNYRGMLRWEYNVANNADRLIKYYYYKKTTGGKVYSDYTRYRLYQNNSYTDELIWNYVDNNYGRTKGIKYGTSGLTLAYDYNDRGYMTTVKNANGGYVYQEIKNLDNHGKVTEQLMTNGLLTQTATHHAATGQMMTVKSETTAGAINLHDIGYSYDGFSNLEMQTVVTGLNGAINSEDYAYDSLHRLTQSNRNLNSNASNITINYAYDAVGNFKNKTDYSTSSLSAYGYNTSGTRTSANGYAGPNAVRSVAKKTGGTVFFNYDLNGNLLSGDGKTISYNEFNKPLTISKSGVTSSFSYGADLMRYKQVKTGAPGGTITTYYMSKLLEKEVQGSSVKYKHYIGDVAVQTKTGSSWDIGFTHRDRLGSVVTVTDANGQVKEHRSYDPFGKPRGGDFVDPNKPTLLDSIQQDPHTGSSLITNRGFTDHEHLDDAELIHMNGRAYDYNLGRFLSVDPFIQAPGNSQSMNPYSYGMNNPMAGTDPSGYVFWFAVPYIAKGIAAGLTAWGAVETAKATGETIAKVELGEIEASDAAIELAKTAGQEMVLRKADVALDVAKAVIKKVDKPNTPKIENGAGDKLKNTEKPEVAPKRAGEVNDVQGPPNMTRHKTDGRHEPDGKPGPRVKVDYADGTKKDITRDRVKETVPNNHPNNPKPGSPDDVKGMENPVNKNGSKRQPTREEKKIVEDKRIKEK